MVGVAPDRKQACIFGAGRTWHSSVSRALLRILPTSGSSSRAVISVKEDQQTCDLRAVVERSQEALTKLEGAGAQKC